MPPSTVGATCGGNGEVSVTPGQDVPASVRRNRRGRAEETGAVVAQLAGVDLDPALEGEDRGIAAAEVLAAADAPA
jgi:surface antigen